MAINPETQEGKNMGKTVRGRSYASIAKRTLFGQSKRNRSEALGKSWELKGSLGLAKLEKGRVLLDFEDLEEACRVVSSETARWKESRKWGDECGGFITIDEQTKTMGELQWARILVRGRGNARPSVLEVEAEEEVYAVSLWWECRPVLRRSCRQADGRHSSEVRGEEISHAEKRVTKGWVSVRLETLHPSDDGTGEQEIGPGRVVSSAVRSP
ncbi:hypothetical protein CK203_028815 [Vitis vinifera]|uniref:DUF4283 domain-containing protein n=1 Tax=Vitis vinifera TaxID=29760 RepID=A0A438IA52_VITVI|nr:hypothetical protein CK203_028815 [Vitis vinifera]